MIGIREARTFILLNVGHAIHHADWNWQNVYSPFARIHYVADGTAEILRGNQRISLRKGYFYLTPPYTKHGYSCVGDLSVYYIHIYEALEKQLSLFDLLNFPTAIAADDLMVSLIKRLVAINPDKALQFYDPRSYDNSSTLIKNISQHNPMAPALEMETEGLLKQIISRFIPQASHKNTDLDERILQAVHHIHSHMDKPIKIDELASMSFLTEDHFIRLFKKQMHCTPGKYINQKKIEQAQLLMLDRQKNIKEIAYQLGFENISYFSRLFKKITGENPGKRQKEMFSSPSFYAKP